MSNELNNEPKDAYVTPTFTDPTIPNKTTTRPKLLESPEQSHHKKTSMGLTGWELRQKIFDTIGNLSTLASTFINTIVSKFKKGKINEPGLLPTGNTPQLSDKQELIIPGSPDKSHSPTLAPILKTSELLVGNLPDLVQSGKTSAEPVAQAAPKEEHVANQTSPKLGLSPETIVTGETVNKDDYDLDK